MARDQWDFYLCRVDDAPASIFLNLAFSDAARQVGMDTLYMVRVDMSDAGEHGMGSAEQSTLLSGIEDAISRAGEKRGVQFVGRLRNHGVWQLIFMGPAGKDAELERVAEAELDRAHLGFDVVSKPDRQWTYYRDFLFPDSERMQWMKDRSVVEALEKHGDRLEKPRRVDHWILFPDEDARSHFSAAVSGLGFEHQETDSKLGLQVHRVDAVDLESIHVVVMELAELAAKHRGEYDGWETSVEKE